MACICFRNAGSFKTWTRVKAATDKQEDGTVTLCEYCGGLITAQPTARESDFRDTQARKLCADDYCADAALPELSPAVLFGAGVSAALMARLSE
jgi:hypothetical protein